MELKSYLDGEGIGYAEFARRIGASHRRTVERYAKGHQRPNSLMMAAIARATNGQVTPNDFFDLSVQIDKAS